jgi:hypothetical protein
MPFAFPAVPWRTPVKKGYAEIPDAPEICEGLQVVFADRPLFRQVPPFIGLVDTNKNIEILIGLLSEAIYQPRKHFILIDNGKAYENTWQGDIIQFRKIVS